MANVMKKFFIASLFMWVTPIAMLFGFNHDFLPGSSQLTPYLLTLVSGFLAVISVNVVIAFYVCMAMKEASDKHEPDEKFVADVRASINRPTRGADGTSPCHKKND